MFTIYIAKAAANYSLTATHPIYDSYERAMEVLSDRQTAKMCLCFAALERKLGEIDRARAIYAHASQFCDPQTNPEFWAEWHTFEIDTGSEDTLRKMLRIKRSVQAQFNTESSYLAARVLAASQGVAKQQAPLHHTMSTMNRHQVLMPLRMQARFRYPRRYIPALERFAPPPSSRFVSIIEAFYVPSVPIGDCSSHSSCVLLLPHCRVRERDT
jgi:hypothetical protein